MPILTNKDSQYEPTTISTKDLEGLDATLGSRMDIGLTVEAYNNLVIVEE